MKRLSLLIISILFLIPVVIAVPFYPFGDIDLLGLWNMTGAPEINASQINASNFFGFLNFSWINNHPIATVDTNCSVAGNCGSVAYINYTNIGDFNITANSSNILYLPFEPGMSNSTYTKDYSGYGHDSTVSSATFNSTGGFDGKGAYHFIRSQSNYMSLPFNDNTNLSGSDFTITAWVNYNKFNGGTTINSILGQGMGGSSGFIFGIRENTNYLFIQIYRPPDSTAKLFNTLTTVQENTWHFVTANYWNGTNRTRICLDSVCNDVNNTGNLMGVPSAGLFEIGRRSNTHYFNGSIDDLRVYNQILTTSQMDLVKTDKSFLIGNVGLVKGNYLSGFLDCTDITNTVSDLCTIQDTDTNTQKSGDGNSTTNDSTTISVNRTWFNLVFNSSKVNYSQIINHVQDTDTQKSGDGNSTTNDSTTISVNRTWFNLVLNSSSINYSQIRELPLDTDTQKSGDGNSTTNDSTTISVNRTWFDLVFNSSSINYSKIREHPNDQNTVPPWDNTTTEIIPRTGFPTDVIITGNISALWCDAMVNYSKIQNHPSDVDTRVIGGGVYLYNDSTTMYLNDTVLNTTIQALSDIDTRMSGDGNSTTNDSTTISVNRTWFDLVFNSSKVNYSNVINHASDKEKSGDGNSTTNDSTTISVNRTWFDLVFNSSKVNYSQINNHPQGISFFYNYTTFKSTGAIAYEDVTGYEAANEVCEAEHPGTHMCQAGEIGNHILSNKSRDQFLVTFRIVEIAPGFTANANDCDSYTTELSTALGAIWVGRTADYGEGSLVSCSANRSIGCCQ